MTATSRRGPQAATGEAPLIIRFAEIEEGDLPLVGAKGYNLGRLLRAGFPVPDGFCLTTHAMRSFIREGGLEQRLRRILEHAAGGQLQVHTSWSFLGETRRLMVETPLPPRLREELRRAYEEGLGRRVVAVRSSGTREDTEAASFAGQYESFLNVRGFEYLEDAVRRCWASIWRNRVLHYLGQQRVAPSDLVLGVVVQILVKAESSGVLFTVDPLTGRDDRMLIEATLGLGETLVSGRVNPDRYLLEARSGELLAAELGDKKLVLRAMYSRDSRGEERFGAGAEPAEEPEEAERLRRTLEPAVLRELVALGTGVQEHFGRPMDIEWARERDGRLQIVQARPITQLGFEPELGEWTDANFKDGGVASGVCTPFMASLYDRIFSETQTRWWREELGVLEPEREVDWLRVFYARPYWNVGEVKRLLMRLPGFVERDFDEDLGIARPYEGPGRVSRLSLVGLLRGLAVLWRGARVQRRYLQAAPAFVGSFLQDYERLDAVDLEALGRSELLERYARLLEEDYVRTESTYFLMVYVVSLAKLDFKAIFDRVQRLAGGALDYLALVSGLTDVAHLRPFVELAEIARRLRAGGAATGGDGGGGRRPGAAPGAAPPLPELGPFLKRYQHHSTRELDITVPRWGEDPSFIERTLRQLVQAPGGEDPRALAQRQVALYERARQQAERCLRRWPLVLRPWWRRRFFRALERLRQIAWWREEVRDCSMRMYWLVRKYTLALGRRLVAEGAIGAPEELFLLRWDQVLALARGEIAPEAARREIAWNRTYLRSFRNFEPPHEIGSRHRYEHGAGTEPDSGAAGGRRLLRGVAGSPGRCRARARVVRRLEEGDRLQPGEVLVTVFTDPGWTPLMSIAGALVTETGGLLSHAAVISREYGIPAVLACAGATLAIADGQELVVDGAAGTVEICAAEGGN
ncbi:MAG: phosphoenolpyruvate synthase [Planctomycetota bacterium]|nr:MAG: phosphoenolpyruvate synthase [Planctomycetota bacterium]